MYVCICNEVTDRDIKKAVGNGATSLKDLQDELNVATCCGSCAMCAKGLLNQSSSTQAAAITAR